MSDLNGKTRVLIPGGKVVFHVIPPGMEEPVPMRYYETFTAHTDTAPNGVTVRLNGMGDDGQPPRMNFLFTQEQDHSIYLYGVLHPDGKKEWITRPGNGRILNYPGTYFVGFEWIQDFEMQDEEGNSQGAIYLKNTVTAIEEVTIPLGTFQAFRINTTEKDESLNSISWFAPELGVNIKKISYSPMRPGYELCETHFSD